MSGNVDAADSILSNYVAGGTNIAGMQTRGTLNAGGGVCAWFLKQIKEGDILTLSSYGYYSKSYDLTGHMVAIRLGEMKMKKIIGHTESGTVVSLKDGGHGTA